MDGAWISICGPPARRLRWRRFIARQAPCIYRCYLLFVFAVVAAVPPQFPYRRDLGADATYTLPGARGCVFLRSRPLPSLSWLTSASGLMQHAVYYPPAASFRDKSALASSTTRHFVFQTFLHKCIVLAIRKRLSVLRAINHCQPSRGNWQFFNSIAEICNAKNQ